MSKTIIKPISLLRNTTEISDYCHQEQEPIHITKNGFNDLVIMTEEVFEGLFSNRPKSLQPTSFNQPQIEKKPAIDNLGFVRVGCHTIKTSLFDVEQNLDEILRHIDEASTNQEKIIVFPELALSGYSLSDLFFQEQFEKNIDEALIRIKKRSSSFNGLIVVGSPYRISSKLYNLAFVFSNGSIIGAVPKSYLPNYREFYEKRQFTSGFDLEALLHIDDEEILVSRKIVFASREDSRLKVGIEICEDLFAPNPPATDLALNGATVILNLSASNELVGKHSYRQSLVSLTSARLHAAYCYTSAGEGESTQDLIYSGASMIYENGLKIAENELFSGDSVYADIDYEKLIKERQNNSSFITRSDYQEIFFSYNNDTIPLFDRLIERNPFLANSDKKSLDFIIKMQAEGLKKRLALTGNKAVIGLSGGLDSTLALFVTLKAMELLNQSPSNIYAYSLPAFGTSKRTKDNARNLAISTKVNFDEIDISEAVTNHLKELDQPLDLHDVTFENAQARERTKFLMNKANQLHAIVIGTGDLSESCLGWSTYNGDHMSNYAVNVSVPKTLVKHLVKNYAESHQELQEIILDIVDTPVSPELLPTKDDKILQKTEDIIGPYELHDFFIFYVLRYGFTPRKIFFLAEKTFKDSYSKRTILKWMRIFYQRFFSQQFKRSCLPDGPKIGSVSISPRGDLRMPSDASSKMPLKEIDQLEKELED